MCVGRGGRRVRLSDGFSVVSGQEWSSLHTGFGLFMGFVKTVRFILVSVVTTSFVRKEKRTRLN